MSHRRLLIPLLSAFAVLVLACSSDNESELNDAGSPSETATAEVTETPRTSSTSVAAATPVDALKIPGVSVLRSAVGQPVEFPPDLGFIIETGCTQCDGPTDGIYRVYRSGNGPVRVDKLVDQGFVESRPHNPVDPYFAAVISDDGSELVVRICSAGHCYAGEPGAENTLYRSTDGGFSWSLLGKSTDGAQPSVISKRGLVMVKYGTVEVRQPDGTVRHEQKNEYRIYPRTPLTAPAGAETLASQFGFANPGGEILWWVKATRSLLREDGSRLASLPMASQEYMPQIAYQEGRPLVMAWTLAFDPMKGPPVPGCYLTAPQADGTHKGLLTVSCAAPTAWLDERYLIANAYYDVTPNTPFPVPAGVFYGSRATLVNMETGEMRPIDGAIANVGGRNRVHAVFRGPFLRVTSTPCLNVRERPGTSAAALHCAPEGVLLRPSGQRQTVEGREWQAVRLPDGRAGWAASEGLE